jgi:class 3 adenylate cyclase
MANLELIKRLNSKYRKSSPFTNSTKSFSINESLNSGNIELSIQNNIRALGPNFTLYFEEGKAADVVLLFIDVCNFSTNFSTLSGKQISSYFDEYYDKVIPIIYEFGGEIDKIIGDGIICIFGQPFLNKTLNQCIVEADKCAKKIIITTKNTKFNSKIAFHFGTINYFKNKSGFYNELTVVGRPLTELFRLESISKNQRINYLVKYMHVSNWNSSINDNSFWWKLSQIEKITTQLKGVDYEYLQTNEYLL